MAQQCWDALALACKDCVSAGRCCDNCARARYRGRTRTEQMKHAAQLSALEAAQNARHAYANSHHGDGIARLQRLAAHMAAGARLVIIRTE